MAKYADGFVITMALDKLEEYRVLAEKSSVIWLECGALEYYECVGDDLDTGEGPGISFTELASAGDGEIVIFSWILYESREHRDKVNAAVMQDPRMKEMMQNMENGPFDPSRMAYGGFQVMVEG